jgi:hypothetical protein
MVVAGDRICSVCWGTAAAFIDFIDGSVQIILRQKGKLALIMS